MTKHVFIFVSVALVLLVGTARGEITVKWSDPELGLIEAIADDIDRDGVLDIIGIKGNGLVIIKGDTGEVKDVPGIPVWPPRLADLDKDGIMEVLTALEAMLSVGATPTQLKIFRKSWLGWKVYFEEKGKECLIHGVADIDGDGRLEIIGSSTGKEMRVYKGVSPSPVWRYVLGTIAQAALGDLDGDETIDIISPIEVETATGRFIKPSPGQLGYNYPIRFNLDVIALKGSDGTGLFVIPDIGKWTRPAITADLTMRGRDDAIIFSDYGLRVVSNGAITIHVDHIGGFFGGAVGDFNKAEGLEIVLVDADGGILALDSGGNKLWEADLGNKPTGQPVIADLKGDGEQQIIFPVLDGRFIALRGNSGSVSFEVKTGRSPSKLLIADVDGDEKLEILCVSGGTGLTVYGTESSGEIQWATAAGDAQGTHSYRLSRAYTARVRFPAHYKVFNWKIVYISLAVLVVLGLVGLLVYSSHRQVEEITGAAPDARGLAELEREYLKNREDRMVVRKLAMEYASRNVTDLKAIEVYQKSFKLVPDQVLITKALAQTYLVRNALNPESEQVFKKAVELAPNDQKLLMGLVTLYSQNKRIDLDTMKIYEKFYYQGLDNPRATAILAKELARQKIIEPLAIHLYHRQLKAEPANAEVLTAMLDYQRAVNNSDEYLNYARAALESLALSLGMQLRIACDFIQWEFFEDADQILKKCVTDHPNDIEAWNAYKDLLVRTGRPGDSKQAANRLVQIYTDLQRANPTLTDFKMALGKLYREMGDPGAAVSQLKTVAPQDQYYHEAAMILTELYVELGELDKAETFFDTIPGAAERHPELLQKIEQLRKSKIFMPTGTDAQKTAVFDAGKTAVQHASPQRYKMLNELGRGGMGVVYKALDTVLNRQVAFKILPEDLRDHPKIAESFAREAQALAALSHPNIVTVFDAGQQAGTLFFVMQYIEGTDLKVELKKSGKMPIKRVVDIAKQLCRALAYAHEKRIVHRDIKTSNVMLTKDGGVMLMDFGLSKFLEESAAGKTAVSGTPYYMSPEQTLGEGIDHRTDIYSLGIMLYELATGRVPFPTGDIGYHHLHTIPEDPRSLCPELSEGFSQIILHCMEKDKEKRYQSASNILKDLDSVA